ncbi:MAG TPA: carboxymuconolactone decarboxylase family protein [Solirubrobacteraceae bacterium]|jgi:AhpD family alkylhydroperoxidase|nr:carboxymuconolactone decarboxylase family protein [Solirubrobacteraceae bacterium]
MMKRIQGAPAGWRKPHLALVYRMARRRLRKLAENQTDRAIEPLEVYGHIPRLLFGFGMFVDVSEKQSHVDRRLKRLAAVKTATLVHCEHCIDVGSSMARRSGLRDEQLLALPRYRASDQFSDLEKLVLDYAVAMTRTPVEVSDELFAALREHFEDRQLVELTSAIAIQNLVARFNVPFGIGAAGFTEGMVCAVPEPVESSEQNSSPQAAQAREPSLPDEPAPDRAAAPSAS